MAISALSGSRISGEDEVKENGVRTTVASPSFPLAIDRYVQSHILVRQQTMLTAAEQGNSAQVIELIEEGVDINAASVWKTAAHFAAERGDLELLQYLVEHGADLSLECDERSQTPLQLAKQAGHEDCAAYLQEEMFRQKGIAIRAVSELKMSFAPIRLLEEQIIAMIERLTFEPVPLPEEQIAAFKQHLMTDKARLYITYKADGRLTAATKIILQQSENKAFKQWVLWDNQAGYAPPYREKGYTSIHRTVSNMFNPYRRVGLAPLEQNQFQQYRALRYADLAAMLGCIEWVEKLPPLRAEETVIKQPSSFWLGCINDPKVRLKNLAYACFFFTPYAGAAANSQIEMLKYMRTKGIPEYLPQHALIFAAQTGNWETIQYLISLCEGDIPLLVAEAAWESGRYDLASYLFTHHIDKTEPDSAGIQRKHYYPSENPNAIGKDGNTYAHLATKQSNTELIAFLGRICVDFEKRDAAGDTPLHIAVKSKQIEIIHALSDAGANINGTNGAGKTPLAIALQLRLKEVIVALLRCGATVDVKAGEDNALRTLAIDYGGVIKETLARHGQDIVSLREVNKSQARHIGALETVSAQLSRVGAENAAENLHLKEQLQETNMRLQRMEQIMASFLSQLPPTAPSAQSSMRLASASVRHIESNPEGNS